MAEPDIAQHLDNIQGNILAGFNKDFQTLLFFQIPDAGAGRAWLAETVPDIATSEQVLAFNQRFSAARRRFGDDEPVRSGRLQSATWVNVAFTYRGLAALGTLRPDLDAFPEEFRQGMAARAELLGDVGESAPERWIEPLRQEIDGVLIVAADRGTDCELMVRRQQQRLARHGLRLLHCEAGKTREGAARGHEHFGFKDGISQPGILGIAGQNGRKDPGDGGPGENLVQPGEFVLGYPTQRSPDQPPPVNPVWASAGSYLVFRRLRQDVQGFREFVSRQARVEGRSEDVMGAKLVGRYRSGAPLELTGDQPQDPGTKAPRLLDSAHVNSFAYGDDSDGRRVPRAAHIRKVYPRDADPPGADEAQLRRLLRRGIPYGESFQERAPPGSPQAADADRGLLFLCYQSSIAGQFEWVQQKMVNNPDFPQPGDGLDPLISQSSGTFRLPGGVQEHVALMRRWVTTTGGGYFFAPSISALHGLAIGDRKERRRMMPDYPIMQQFYKFVAMVWASDNARTHDGHPRPLVEEADEAAAAAVAAIATAARGANGSSSPLRGDEVRRIREIALKLAAKAIATAHAKVAKAAAPGPAPVDTVAQAAKADPVIDGAETRGMHAAAEAIVKASNAWTLALKEFGVNVPPNRVIYVHRNTDTEYHYVVPELPATNPTTLETLASQAVPYSMTCN